MIPIRIELVNFRAIPYANIDLSDVSIAAICGRNGAGKSSTFTMAPIFALFGDKIKGISMDDLVRRGSQEMAVTFEFEHQSSVYRVIRTRSTKGNGKSTLELQQQVGGRWESRSAEKIKDTEDVIRNLLNLDVETFTASSMILQGQANAFTGSTPGKRKEILTQILGLNVYEQLQERARQRAALLHVEIEKAKDKLADLNERLLSKSEKVEKLLQIEQDLKNVQLTIQNKEAEMRKQEEQLRTLQTKAEKVIDIAQHIATLDDEHSALYNEKVGILAKVERVEKILANEEGILAKTVEFHQVKEQIAVLEARFPDRERLQREQVQLKNEQVRIMNESRQLIDRINILEQLLAKRELLREKANEFEQSINGLAVFEAQADEWNLIEAELSDVRAKYTKEEQRIALLQLALEQEIKSLGAKTAMLQDSNCIDVTRAACRFLVDAQESKVLIKAKQAEFAKLDVSQLGELGQKIVQLEERQKAIGYDHVSHRSCKVRKDHLQPFVTQYAQLAGKDDLLQSLREQRSSSDSRKEAIDEKLRMVNVDLNKLEIELTALPTLQERVGKLQAWVNLKDELAAAREAKQNAEERIESIDREVQRKAEQRSTLEEERSVLVLDTLQLDEERMKVATLQIEIKQHREQETRLVSRIGGLQTEIAALEKDEQEHERLAAELKPKSNRWSRYQTLIRAFGRDGIPALIIENAVPELERIANEILSQMSKGKHYVRFETQRELKSRDGVSETLDIMIGDWTAERPYETFSGGEQLRIDYAIRFALAELLALRAGSKIEWLTIDEGLGSQDTEHRQLVLESIKSVADRFKKVLVITHIEEAQAVFDQHIYFDSSESGVEVKVA